MKILTCQTELVDNQCSNPIWVDMSYLLPSTEEFTAASPHLIAILALAWGFKILLRQLFNRR